MAITQPEAELSVYQLKDLTEKTWQRTERPPTRRAAAALPVLCHLHVVAMETVMIVDLSAL